MTRRTGRWIIGACLCVGLLPGCALTNLNIFRRDKADKVVDGQKVATKELGDRHDVDTGDTWPSHDQAQKTRGRAEFDSPYNSALTPFIDPRRRTDPRFITAGALPDSTEIPPWQPPQQAPGALPIARESEPPTQPLPPPEPEVPLVRALYYLVKGDHKGAEVALAHLERYDQPTQDVIKPVLLALADLNSKSVAQLSQEELTVLQDQLEGSLLALRARSRLVIQKMVLCEQIAGFGQYRPLPENHRFLPACKDPGRPGEMVQIYVELCNVGSVRSGQAYETLLSSKVEITDDSRRGYYQRNLKAQNRPLRSPIMCSECFHGYSFCVPPIPPGHYTLTLTVTDHSTKPARTVSKHMPFIVAAN
ncbi:MAG: hypothetical protein L0Z62_38335 [Gemmataceae bacterium]|nr:hypothetical protein [Gemmataceae bacterium]